jgi:hypothetical protein
MKLEVGGYYVLRNGAKVGPLGDNRNTQYPFFFDHTSWTQDGRYYCDSVLDVVAEDPLWTAVSTAVNNLERTTRDVEVDDRCICHLALKHPSKAAKLMDTDDGFRLAAHQLAEKLAHALLEDGEAYRRPKQKVNLWLAACKILLDSGADVSFGDSVLVINP